MDWLALFKDLAVSFFNAFAHAVQEYPLPTALVFLVAALLYFERTKNKEEHDPLWACIFVGAVFAANVIGWIFNAVLWVFQKLFGWSEVFAGPFSKDPIAFLLSLFAALTIGFGYLAYRYKLRLRQIPLAGFALAAFSALFFAYIFTNVYVQATKRPEPKTVEKNSTVLAHRAK